MTTLLVENKTVCYRYDQISNVLVLASTIPISDNTDNWGYFR